MDVLLPRIPPFSLLIPAVLVGGLLYSIHRFTSRISPTIPYVGEGSLSARLSVPIEYGKDPIELLRKARQQLGDVFCVDLFIVKIVFFLGAEGNKTVLRSAEDKLSFMAGIKWAMGSTIGNMLDDPEWASVCFKMVKYALQNQDRLQNYIESCSKMTDEHLEEWATMGTIPLFKSISHLIISYMLTVLAGEEFCRKHGDELFPRMAQFERDLQSPFLRALPPSLWNYTKPGRALHNTTKRVEELIDLEVKDIMENPEKHKSRGDYLYYMTTQVGDKFAHFYGMHITNLVFAGHANVAMTVPWLLLHARRTPGALERIREEALQPPDVQKPYTEACFRETGRLYSSAMLVRRTTRTTSVSGHTIPPGTLVACSPLATQREDHLTDSRGIYDDAGRWNPDRFLSKPTSYANWFQKVEFVQFGWGTHACPGEKLARMFVFDLVLKGLVEKFDIDVVSGLEEGVKGIDGVGAEGAWTEENMGTPSVRGEDVMVSLRRR